MVSPEEKCHMRCPNERRAKKGWESALLQLGAYSISVLVGKKHPDRPDHPRPRLSGLLRLIHERILLYIPVGSSRASFLPEIEEINNTIAAQVAWNMSKLVNWKRALSPDHTYGNLYSDPVAVLLELLNGQADTTIGNLEVTTIGNNGGQPALSSDMTAAVFGAPFPGLIFCLSVAPPTAGTITSSSPEILSKKITGNSGGFLSSIKPQPVNL